MALNISLREGAQASIIDVEGDLVLPECRELHLEVKKVLQTGTRRVGLNLEKVTGIDQHGLGTLSSCYVSVLREFAKLSVLRPSAEVFEAIKRIRLEQVVTVYDTEEEFLKVPDQVVLNPVEREGLHFVQQLQQIACGVVWVFLGLVVLVLWMQFPHPGVLNRMTWLELLGDLVLSPVTAVSNELAPILFYLFLLLFMGSLVLLLFDSRLDRLRRLLK